MCVCVCVCVRMFLFFGCMSLSACLYRAYVNVCVQACTVLACSQAQQRVCEVGSGGANLQIPSMSLLYANFNTHCDTARK